MIYPPGTAVMVTAWQDMETYDHLLANLDGEIVTVIYDDGNQVYVSGGEKEVARLVPHHQVRISPIIMDVMIVGLPRIALSPLKTALERALGTPFDIDHHQMQGDPHIQVDAIWHLTPLPGESLDAIAWRTAIATWRGGRTRPEFPIPRIQVRIYTNDTVQREHGEWPFGPDDHAALLATYPNVLVF